MEIIFFHLGLNSCSIMDMVLYETRLARNMWQHVTLQQSDIHASAKFFFNQSNHTRSLNQEGCPNKNLLYVTAGWSKVLRNNTVPIETVREKLYTSQLIKCKQVRGGEQSHSVWGKPLFGKHLGFCLFVFFELIHSLQTMSSIFPHPYNKRVQSDDCLVCSLCGEKIEYMG